MQVSPLRFAPVEMTEFGVVEERQKQRQMQVSPLRFAPVEITEFGGVRVALVEMTEFGWVRFAPVEMTQRLWEGRDGRDGLVVAALLGG